MPESTTDLNTATSQTYDAQQMAEEIAKGEQKAPKVDVEADYEAAQEFSVSEVDRTGEGESLAADAVAPQHQVPQAEAPKLTTEPTGDPDQYREMAKEVGHQANAPSTVSDELVQKALEKGQPAQ